MTGVIGTGLSALDERRDYDAHLDELAALGCETVELPLYAMDVVVGGRIRQAALRPIRAACAGRPFRYTVHGPLAINFFDEPFRLPRHFEVLKASMEASAELDAIHYVIHAGMMPMKQVPGIESAYGHQREWLAKAGDLAEALGMFVCVENLFRGHDGRIYTPTPSRLAAELAAIGHPRVVATLDFGHANLQRAYTGDDLIAEVSALAPHAKHLHIHDNFGLADDIWTFGVGEKLAFGHGDLHLPVGWGNLPWEAIIDACAFPDDVVFNIELEGRYWQAAAETVVTTKQLAAKAAHRVRPAA
ncbi:MAG TPA: sugar phosphate isomerase/epimerase [Bauldia sp.]|nr:sugar phosphate isomerase/epimerase [Bauldia sp.]